MPVYILEIRNQHAVRDQIDLIMADRGFAPKLGHDEDDFNHLTYEGRSSLSSEEFATTIKSQLQLSLQHDIEVSIACAADQIA